MALSPIEAGSSSASEIIEKSWDLDPTELDFRLGSFAMKKFMDNPLLEEIDLGIQL